MPDTVLSHFSDEQNDCQIEQSFRKIDFLDRSNNNPKV